MGPAEPFHAISAARRWIYILLATALPAAAQTIVVGGNYTSALTTGLTSLHVSYLTSSATTPDPASFNLHAGDTIIISNDGSASNLVDYRPFLNLGGHVIIIGGSNDNGYRTWVGTYFNTTDTSNGWHTDGAWQTTALAYATGVPAAYTFENSSATYHMIGFLPTTNTVLYGQNSEPNYIAAFQTFANGGNLNYMALDVGRSDYLSVNDYNNFFLPWLSSALTLANVPEPSTVALLSAGLIALALRRKPRA